MLTAGMDLLAETGVVVGVGAVSFDDAIAAADAPRASAYRAWADDNSNTGPQVRFHDELAAKILREQPGSGTNDLEGALTETLAAANEVLGQMPDIAGMSPAERGHWLRETHRRGSHANQTVMDGSRLWHIYVAVAAGLMSQDEVPEELLKAWADGEFALIERYKDLYRSMAELFGFRLRYCYTWEQFDTAAGALAEGLMLRSKVNPHLNGIIRKTGPNGEEQDWNLFGICFEGLIRQFFEPDDGEIETLIDHEQ